MHEVRDSVDGHYKQQSKQGFISISSFRGANYYALYEVPDPGERAGKDRLESNQPEPDQYSRTEEET